MQIREVFDRRRFVLLDGGMGTQLQSRGLQPGEKPELAALTMPDTLTAIHRDYAAAGADILLANTFGANAKKLAGCGYTLQQVIQASLACARTAAEETGALVGLDIGPLGELLAPAGTLAFADAYDRFAEVIRLGAEAGADLVFLETMTDLYELKAAILAAKETCTLPVFTSMSFEARGRTFTGCTVESYAVTAVGLGADAVGINCSLGPKEILPFAKRLCRSVPAGVPVFVKPNAGLPNPDGSYNLNAAEFAAEMQEYAATGISMLGGCCGTTPAHIAALRAELDTLPQQTEVAPAAKLSTGTAPAVEKDDAFLRKLNAGEKVIAIELDSPRVADLSGYLDGARRLQAAGADLLTIADCPIAQARMDSSLVACRVHRELGMCALPHMTCRDRNLNATKALLLGLYAEGVREVLAITGDPIPTAERDEVKNVYQFNSRKLAQYIVSLAGEGREMPSAMTVFGALNLNARNFDVELRRAVEKLENGMSGFLTQPVLSAQAVENLCKARQTLGERAKILAGIMPVVSQRNAIFMENEINGIHVEEDIIQRFAGLDREQGEALGLEVSMQMAREALPYADGFYLMTPFNRVALMERLIARLKTELLDAEG